MSTGNDSQKITQNNEIIDSNNQSLSELQEKIASLPNKTGGGGGIVNIDDIPIATNEQLGVVKIGEGIAVTEDGSISVNSNTILTMTGEKISSLDSAFNGVVLCIEDFNEIKSGSIYVIENGEIINTITVSGGGGQLNTNTSTTISELEQNVAIGKSLILKYNFDTTAIGKGTAKLFVNGVLKSSKVISKGENEFDVSQYINAGANYFTITISDSNSSVVTLDYIINGIKLTMTSNFNAALVYTGDVTYRYTVVGAGLKTVTFEVDDNIVGTTEIRSSGNESSYVLKNLTHGVHKLEVYATTVLGEETITSNILSYKIVYAEEGVTTPIISSNFSTTTCRQGELLNIDYLVYDPLASNASVQLQINDNKPLDVQVDRTMHYWTVSDYPVGDVTFKITCKDICLLFNVTVEEINIDLEPITENLQLYLTAANRNNAELEGEREVWKFGDIESQLTNFNWSSNGWMNGALKLTGAAKVYIPFNIFQEDLRQMGKTIEIEFMTHNVSDLSSELISCFANNKGIKVTSTECIMKTEQEQITVRFKENEKIRLSIVIDDSTTNRLIKTYINGVLSGIAQYSMQDNFQQNNPVGITINEGGEEINIYSIRVYNMALTSRNILDNYIYDITDINEKLVKFASNDVYDIYGDISLAKLKSMIPILQITGELPPSKGDKKTVSTIYTDPVNPTFNFEYSNCTIDIQGTSSQYYPKKNYKIKFPEKFAFYEGATPEKTYTFKADYMESSHSHNTGNAVFINDLYDEFFPTRTADNGVRDCIYGFPCAIFYRADENSDYEYFGAYNFNNDKGNSDTLGLTTDKAESWEFCNNTSLHCLLRNDDFSEESGVKDNFEARYPEEYEDNPDYTALQRVVSWIVSTEGNIDKFKNEFTEYFNLHYTLIYYVLMEFALMADSRAKNMFFDTADGKIWYPRFYDMDTCYGLNNEGVLEFGYGLEQHDSIGSLKVYNGENSLFWNNFEEAYADEIQAMYLSLRASKKLTYDSVMKVFLEHQIGKFNEAQYNEDAKFKYINPINESNDTTYLYVAQGTRLAHFQWWVYNRLNYLDSKYETPEFIADFITMRLYTTNGDFDLIPYVDQYLKIKFGSTTNKVRGVAGQATRVPAPAGLEFNDTETIIYGGSNISDLGDVSTKYAGTVDVSRAKKLQRLKVGSGESGYQNTNLKQLSLGNNTLLESIDIQNCPNLTGNLDVSGCIKLSEFLAQGTGIAGVTFVDGGDLKVVRLPKSLTSLIIKNHRNIEELKLDSSMSIQTLVLKNTNIDAFKLLVTALNVTRLYVYLNEENNATIRKSYLDYLIDTCGGVDDNDLNMTYPNIQGYLTVQYDNDMPTNEIQEMKDNYALFFPELKITYVAIAPAFTYTYTSSTKTLTVKDDGKSDMVVYPSREAAIAKYNQKYPNNVVNLVHANTTATKNVVTSLIPNGYDSASLTYANSTNLQTLKVGADNVSQANFYNCSNIKELDLGGMGITNNNFIVSQCTNLERLSNYYFTNNIIPAHFTNCYNLKELDFTGCNVIRLYQSNPAIFQSLYDVKFINAPQFYLNSIGGNYFVNCRSIEYLNLLVPKMAGQSGNTSRLYVTRDCYNLKSIDLYYEELQDIHGRLAFGSNYLTDINVYINGYNQNILNQEVEWSLFYDGRALKNITMYGIPEGLCFNLETMFSHCCNLENISFGLNLTHTNSLAYAFQGCYNLKTVNLYGNTQNIRRLTSTFLNCFNLDTDVNFDVPNATSFTNAFKNCYNLRNISLKISNPQKKYMSTMCYNCCNLQSFTLEGKVSNIESLDEAFFNCINANINVDMFDFDGIRDANYAFHNALLYSSTNKIYFNNIYNMLGMFYNSRGLVDITLNLGNNITYGSTAFQNMQDLKKLTIESQNFPNALSTSAFSNCLNLTDVNLTNANNIYNAYLLFNNCCNLTNVTLGNNTFASGASLYGMFSFTNINNLDFLNGKLKNISNFTNTFYNCKNLQSIINLDNIFQNNAVEDGVSLSGMFRGCDTIKEVIGNTFPNTSKIGAMFHNCSNLKKISIHEPNNMFIYTENSFSSMVGSCYNIEEINLSNCIINSAIGNNLLFASLLNGKINVKILNLANCKGVKEYHLTLNSSARYPNLDSLDLSGIDTLTQFNLSRMEYSNINVSNCSNLTSIIFNGDLYQKSAKNNGTYYNVSFENCHNLPAAYLTIADLHNVSFANCYNLSTLNISSCQNVSSINLNNCTNIQSLYFGGTQFLNNCKIDIADLPKLSYVNSMFYACTIKNSAPIQQFLSQINWTNVKNSDSLFAQAQFSNNKFELSNVGIKDATRMFKSTLLEEIEICNCGNLQLLNSAFISCDALDTLKIDNCNIESFTIDATGLNTTNLKTISIKNCHNLRTISVNKNSLQKAEILNCSNLTSITGIFNGCKNLTSVSLNNCSNIQLAISAFENTLIQNATILTDKTYNQLTNCNDMFYNCTQITEVALNGENLPAIRDFSYAFKGCSNLKDVIIKNFNSNLNIKVDSMFALTAIKNLSFINCGTNSLFINNSFIDDDIGAKNIEEIFLDNSMININGILDSIHTSSTSNLKNIFINGDFIPFGNSVGIFSKCNNLEYVFNNEEYPLTLYCWHGSQYQMNAFVGKDLYLLASSGQLHSMNFIGRDATKLSQFPISQLQAYEGINKITYIYDKNSLGFSHFELENLAGVKKIEIKNLNTVNNCRCINLDFSGAAGESSLDNYVLKNLSINLGDISRIQTLYTYHNLLPSKANYIYDLQFTNCGQGHIDGIRSSTYLYIENLPALTQNCLVNIIENGLCNLAEHSLTGNIRMCNEQVEKLTEDNLALLSAKGWTLKKV